MSDTLTRIPEELVVPQDPESRLLIRCWDAVTGKRLVTITPQLLRGGEWRLKHSGLAITPTVARQLAPALVAMSATIEDSPQDPMPTAEDRELSRRP